MKTLTGEEFVKLYVKNGRILPNDVDCINGDLWLDNNKITVLENLPQSIQGHLYLSNNKIKVIQNLPQSIQGNLYLSNNPIYNEGIVDKQSAYKYLKQMKLKEIKEFI